MKKAKAEKRKLRILVLFEVHDPPAPDEEYGRRMREEPDWRTEGHVVDALREIGHEVHLGAIWKNAREVVDRGRDRLGVTVVRPRPRVHAWVRAAASASPGGRPATSARSAGAHPGTGRRAGLIEK